MQKIRVFVRRFQSWKISSNLNYPARGSPGCDVRLLLWRFQMKMKHRLLLKRERYHELTLFVKANGVQFVPFFVEFTCYTAD